MSKTWGAVGWGLWLPLCLIMKLLLICVVVGILTGLFGFVVGLFIENGK